MLHCYNRGCGQTYDPEQNNEDSCCHHPGAPFFHDAYKGWSCCNKKSVDFTEFLNIKGCTLSRHSNVKPPEPEKPTKECLDVDINQEVVEVRAPIKKAMERPPVDTPLQKVQVAVAPTLKESIDKRKTPKNTATVKEKLKEGEIVVGTSCKNSACTYSFTGTSADNAECQFHSGVPIFHEGMKYWSCCQRKTSDFNVFMSQKGCVTGPHRWVKENEDKKVVSCRYDWHQTASNVIVAIYAKMYHYAESIIEVNPVRLHVNLVFPEQENAKFNLDLELRGVIDVGKTTAHMYGTKVEITMPKAEPGSWPKLDFQRAQLPLPKKGVEQARSSKQSHGSGSDDDFDLDDIETVNEGVRLSELASCKKDDLD